MMKLQVLEQNISTGCHEPSACEACGQTFDCGAAQASCWCSDVKLSEAALAELRTLYRRCLCRSCLESFAAGARTDGPALGK